MIWIDKRVNKSSKLPQNIRIYNSALSFIFLEANIDHQITSAGSVYTFRIHGREDANTS
uniref:Uncharacterized protein n=1 Tax=Rhizophagus irregularis (strain DAOM 181602 / DAOM 197198 / MUCL 43194) TaxID=747089 RepID=U9U8L5_RHIID